ncbi:FmdB family zinc ribbon protein [Thermoflexus sp.]|uniref:FmdB family zinc ribbon protein n=1 Tax=Thermoflexus sp. TaxID=1969742 RepID=UPI0017682500|nr:FmdB family zinc ribbon protein [Thermoflexus sp.]
MPIYEYECPVCGIRFEKQQRFTDPPLETCPEGHPGIRRVFSPAGIIFKGDGWYITESRKSRNSGDKGKSESASGTSTNESD